MCGGCAREKLSYGRRSHTLFFLSFFISISFAPFARAQTPQSVPYPMQPMKMEFTRDRRIHVPIFAVLQPQPVCVAHPFCGRCPFSLHLRSFCLQSSGCRFSRRQEKKLHYFRASEGISQWSDCAMRHNNNNFGRRKRNVWQSGDTKRRLLWA